MDLVNGYFSVNTFCYDTFFVEQENRIKGDIPFTAKLKKKKLTPMISVWLSETAMSSGVAPSLTLGLEGLYQGKFTFTPFSIRTLTVSLSLVITA